MMVDFFFLLSLRGGAHVRGAREGRPNCVWHRHRSVSPTPATDGGLVPHRRSYPARDLRHQLYCRSHDLGHTAGANPDTIRLVSIECAGMVHLS